MTMLQDIEGSSKLGEGKTYRNGKWLQYMKYETSFLLVKLVHQMSAHSNNY